MLKVNEETGEVYEVNENQLVEQKLMEVGAIDKHTYDLMEEYLTIKDKFETVKFKLEKAMKENGIKKWDNDYFTATCRNSSYQKRVDTDALKRDGLYDKYSQIVKVKGSLSIEFKEKV